MRKAANKRRIQECRGKLDSGDEIDIDSPVLAAALLKVCSLFFFANN